MSKDTSTFSVSAAKALFEAAKKPEVRNAAVAAAKNPYVRQTAKNVAQDERARGAVLNAVKDPSGGNKISAAFAVADANRKADDVPPPPPHRGGTSPGKLSGTHSAIRSQLENLHLGGSTISNNSSAISPSYQSNNYNTTTNSSASYQSSYTPSAMTSAPVPPPPVPRHNSSAPSYSTPAISTPHGIAKFEYVPTQSDEMALRVGDTVLLSKKVDAEWFYGENQNSRAFGIVPSSYLDIKIPLKEAFSAPPPRPAAPSGSSSSGTYATAIYDYNSSEYGDLNFTSGTQIIVTARVNEEWLEGECFGRTGIFPVQFVDCPNLYQVPMKASAPVSSFSQPLPINNVPKQSVTVSYDYDSGVPTDLRLYEGDVITVLEDVDSQWLFAECRGQQGMVPKNFLGPPYGSPKKASKGIAEIASAFSPKKAMAIGDYHSEDPKHLYVTRGDHLLIVEDVDEYYYKGKLEAFKTLPAGIVPKNIVKIEH